MEIRWTITILKISIIKFPAWKLSALSWLNWISIISSLLRLKIFNTGPTKLNINNIEDTELENYDIEPLTLYNNVTLLCNIKVTIFTKI